MIRADLLKPLACACLLLAFPAATTAQSLYSAAVTINGSAVTYFEIEQRARMLELIGSLGDTSGQARGDLVDDRVRQQAARALGLTVSADELQTGMTEFAQRANMTPEQFTEALAKDGVYPETFQDFVRAGILWRKVVQTRFQAKAFISESEIDTAMALGTTAVGASILVSEMIIPVPQGTEEQTLELANALSKRLRSFDDFEEAALTYSVASSRGKGGKLDWMPITNLPPQIGDRIMTMQVGAITPPIRLPNAVALFQLRGIRNNRTIAAKTLAYDYATLLLPGGQSAETRKVADKLAASIDTCGDLLAKSAKYPADYFAQQVTPVAKVPKKISRELANLDANEVSTHLSQGENGDFMVFLMLCGRTNSLSEGNREDVRMALFNQRMEAFGSGYLQELKGDAIIVEQ